ncbi:hypothetical protein AB0H92_17840, partial [Streptomyces phaeochromogenes]
MSETPSETTGGTPGTLDELARRAGKWLSLSAAAPERHTTAVVADRFDRITWRDTYEQSAALRELAEELNERDNHTSAHPYDNTTDLLTDVFLAAYKVNPRLRERAEMDPSRLVNHQVITSLVESPESAELRRETAGDPYAAAMAVLAQATALRRMLEATRGAQDKAEQAKQSQQKAERAATAVTEALQQAAEKPDEPEMTDEPDEPAEPDRADEDGAVPPQAAADAVQQAIEAAEASEAAAQQAAQAAAASSSRPPFSVTGMTRACPSSARRPGVLYG